MFVREPRINRSSEFFYIFNNGKYKERKYKLDILICGDPFCKCRNITINFSLDSFEKHEIFLDITNRKLIEEKIKPSAEAFGKAFINDLTQNDWDDVLLIHDELKSTMCELTDFSSWTTDFPFEDIKRGNLIFYDEIVPYSIPVLFRINDTDIQISDMYCLNPECKCTEVHLLFYPIYDSKNNESLLETHITYNYLTEDWIIEEIGELGVKPEQLMERLIYSFNAKSIYQNRHKNLRILYKNSRKKYIKDNVEYHSIKVGRNDLCPCGSGKKYKQCCINQ